MWRRFVLFLIVAGRAWACSCAVDTLSIKGAWEQASAVFLGTVELANPDGDGDQMTFQRQHVRIRVDEAYKGVTDREIVELDQDANDCEAKFGTGRRAVFYLREGKTERWRLPECTHSLGSAEPGGEDLLFLRALPQSAERSRISGEISRRDPGGNVRGVPNVRVFISSGSFRKEVRTNPAGVYEIYDLPPGPYSVAIVAPSSFKEGYHWTVGSPHARWDDTKVIIGKRGHAGVSFVLEPDTSVRGRVLNANGAPIKNVCVNLVPVEGVDGNDGRFMGCTNNGGIFAVEMMPPGDYWLRARDEVKLDHLKSTSTLYYPGVRARESATKVSVEAGRHVKNLDIRLPTSEIRRTIRGRLVFADGVPISKTKVTFSATRHGYSETTETGADGSFGFTVATGMDGQIIAGFAVFEPLLASCPEFRADPHPSGMIRIMEATPVSVVVDSNHEDIILKMSSPSCKTWLEKWKR